MKTNYKLYIMNSAPLTDDEIELMDLSSDFANRLVVDEYNPQIASIILSSDSSGNPDLDEVSIFIDEISEWGNAGVFFGYPKEDGSNEVDENSGADIWNLLDECEVKLK